LGKNTTSYRALVEKNALAKAEAAADKVRSGIIIAADTVVVQDGKIFGKPASLTAARKMLLRLCAKPQVLYTGLAVIDKRTLRRAVSCEKTRIFMDRLSPEEIGRYFKRVSPLDKAGGFDIQGQGAFFIRRIEGCFYNVVGLPVRRLRIMLKGFGINLLLALCCIYAAGCSTEYNIVTHEQETYYYSTDREVQLGRNIARAIDKEYKMVEDPLVQHRVEEIGKRIVAVCDRKDISYTFKVLDEEDVNAVSLRGGYVYVFKGLIDKVENDDELAGVLAHEVSHIVARHSIKKLQAMQGYNILRILVSQAPVAGAGEVGAAADAAFTELLLGYSREDELLSDQLGARYAKAAGYNPRGMLDFLTTLQEVNKRKPLRPKSYFKTHPYVPDRVRVVKQELGENISYTDYINIEQEPHQ
ncbi:MAG: Maf family nucleotide pyrophosphatase, partial [Candidatus Omnitrophica bacterium]|nr:Maf family nucleotide pyrophosphatase [Candidatus Omnitrophota bacterium]